MAGLIPVGGLVAASDLTTAANIRQGGTESQKSIDERIGTQVSPLVAQALAADDAPAAAAVVAVAGALAAQSLAYTLVYGLNASPAAMSVVFGSPAFTSPAKFGAGAMSAGTVSVGAQVPQPVSAPVTVECWVKLDSPPPLVKVVLAFAGVLYLAVEPTGYASFTLSATAQSKVMSAINVCDGAWHHLAFEVTQPAGIITEWKFWVDGVPVVASPTISARAWTSTLTVGGFSSVVDYQFPGRIDDVRVSDIARYTGSFTPPAVAHALDASVVVLADMETIDYTRLTLRYLPRPVGALAGAVTYVGPVEPSDWATSDRWVQV